VRRIVWDQSKAVGEWVSQRMGATFDPSCSTAIGMERDGELIAGVVFDHFSGRSIAMHVAATAPHWMTREYARACFGYAFGQLRVTKVIGLVDSTNAQARRFDEHLGFELEATVKDAGERGDLLIYSMTPDKCRFLGAQHG
jgi:RimJ/RimL family protein N-acetyltransferase